MDNLSKSDEARKKEQNQEYMCPLTAKTCYGKRCMWWHTYDDEYEDGACAMGVIADAIRWMCNSGVNTFEQNYSEEMNGIANAVRGLNEEGITTYEQN